VVVGEKIKRLALVTSKRIKTISPNLLVVVHQVRTKLGLKDTVPIPRDQPMTVEHLIE